MISIVDQDTATADRINSDILSRIDGPVDLAPNGDWPWEWAWGSVRDRVWYKRVIDPEVGMHGPFHFRVCMEEE